LNGWIGLFIPWFALLLLLLNVVVVVVRFVCFVSLFVIQVVLDLLVVATFSSQSSSVLYVYVVQFVSRFVERYVVFLRFVIRSLFERCVPRCWQRVVEHYLICHVLIYRCSLQRTLPC